MIKDKIAQAKIEIAAIKAQADALSRTRFKELTQELFNTYSNLTSFGFKAYPNYFNDGDECPYIAHTDYPDINGIDGYDIDNARYYKEKGQDIQESTLLAVNLQSVIKEFIKSFDNDFYQNLVGAHVKVVITRDNIEITEYADHD